MRGVLRAARRGLLATGFRRQHLRTTRQVIQTLIDWRVSVVEGEEPNDTRVMEVASEVTTAHERVTRGVAVMEAYDADFRDAITGR